MPSLPASCSASTSKAINSSLSRCGVPPKLRRLLGAALPSLRAGFQRAERLVIPSGLQGSRRFEDVGCNLPQMTEKLGGARLPRKFQCVRTAGGAWHIERPQAGLPQVVVEDARRVMADDVDGTGDGIGSDGHAAGQGFELDDAKCVGPAWKHEDIGGR